MRPAVVIFDMDDVLCRYDLGQRLRALSRFSGARPRDIRAAVWDSGFEDDVDAGRYLDPDGYLDEFGRRIGFPLSEEQWVSARRQAMVPWPEMLALAAKIGGQARLAIYSNNGPLTARALPRLFPQAAAIFEERYFSFEFGRKKPDPSSYIAVAGRMGVDPAICWFIDDKKSNVEGARIAGMSGHHFRGHDELRNEALDLGFDV